MFKHLKHIIYILKENGVLMAVITNFEFLGKLLIILVSEEVKFIGKRDLFIISVYSPILEPMPAANIQINLVEFF